MKKPITIPFAQSAILTLAAIKSAVEAFERGDSNAFETLEAILVAGEAHQSATRRASRKSPRKRDAA